jgi:uncharacterized protein (DUF58 family)
MASIEQLKELKDVLPGTGSQIAAYLVVVVSALIVLVLMTGFYFFVPTLIKRCRKRRAAEGQIVDISQSKSLEAEEWTDIELQPVAPRALFSYLSRR